MTIASSSPTPTSPAGDIGKPATTTTVPKSTRVDQLKWDLAEKILKEALAQYRLAPGATPTGDPDQASARIILLAKSFAVNGEPAAIHDVLSGALWYHRYFPGTVNAPVAAKFVIHLAETLAKNVVQTLALAVRDPSTVSGGVERQAAIENALSAALWHVRHGSGPQALQTATGRAIRAVAVLKRACAESASCGRA